MLKTFAKETVCVFFILIACLVIIHSLNGYWQERKYQKGVQQFMHKDNKLKVNKVCIFQSSREAEREMKCVQFIENSSFSYDI